VITRVVDRELLGIRGPFLHASASCSRYYAICRALFRAATRVIGNVVPGMCIPAAGVYGLLHTLLATLLWLIHFNLALDHGTSCPSVCPRLGSCMGRCSSLLILACFLSSVSVDLQHDRQCDTHTINHCAYMLGGHASLVVNGGYLNLKF
jgi:hypothetical protein